MGPESLGYVGKSPQVFEASHVCSLETVPGIDSFQICTALGPYVSRG
jgi:hypothetical protein